MNVLNRNKLKNMRITRGVEVERMEQMLEISALDYLKFENGTHEPEETQLEKIADVLQCKPKELMLENVTLWNQLPFEKKDLDVAERLMNEVKKMATDLSDEDAEKILSELNGILVPAILNRISYTPEFLKNFAEQKIADEERSEKIFSFFQALCDRLKKICPIKPGPLKTKIIFPQQQEEKKIPLYSSLTDVLIKMHERRRLLLPDFSNSKTVLIFSDYGGDSKQERFKTYSFLFADYDSVGTIFHQAMTKIRNEHFVDYPNKEISFKEFGNRNIDNALSEYLNVVNMMIHGLLVTLVVDKNIKGLFGDKRKILAAVNKSSDYKWKNPDLLEKMMVVASIVAYFLKLLVEANHKVFWLTDNDPIFANDKVGKVTSQTVGNILESFCRPFKFKTFGYGKSGDFEKFDLFSFIDALSLTDITGGAMNHYLTKFYTAKETCTEETFEIKSGADKVTRWLTYQGFLLNKMNLMIRAENGNVIASSLEFHLKSGEKLPENLQYVDIEYPVVEIKMDNLSDVP